MDAEFIRDLFSEFGAVDVRRMFGGAGIFADGLMFALVSGGAIYLKSDSDSVPDFERENSVPFAYGTKDGRRAIMSYWRLPERLYDDPEELARWAERALVAARRGAAGKAGKSRKKKKRS